MTSLLALYMVNQLLLPAHVGSIAGFAEFRAALEWLAGPLSTQALASQIFGLYSGFVYFTPLLGGMIADRWIGQRNAVVIGALSMSAGHIAMTFDRSFLGALLLLVMGSGFLKGNISAQVGALYPLDDEVRRTRGFIIFSTAINVGAVAGPLVCGLLAQFYGWHYGFGVAAIFMLLGLLTYLYGYRYLPARVERQKLQGTRLTAAERRIVFALIAVMIITIFQSIAILSSLQRQPDLDSTVRRARRRRFPDSGPLVPSDQSGFQRPGCAAGILDMASTGLAQWRTQRTCEGWHGGLDRGREQSYSGGRNPRFGGRTGSSNLAIRLQRRTGNLLSLLLADASRARFPRCAGQSKCHADGTDIHEPVHCEQSDRLDRRLLREDGSGSVLGITCGHRVRGRRIGRAIGCRLGRALQAG